MKTLPTLPALLVITFGMIAPGAMAQGDQEPAALPSKPSFGLSAGHYRYDPGVGIEFTTRGVFQNRLSLRLKGNTLWLEDYKAIHYEWVSYHAFSVGLVYNGMLFDRTRFYAEIGMVGIVPNSRFSDRRFVEGLYELNGLEINLLQKENHTISFFLGVGPSFIKAFAEKIEGRPRYGHGLNFVNGFRVYIGK